MVRFKDIRLIALSFVTMIFVKHGDNKPEAKRGLDAFEDLDD